MATLDQRLTKLEDAATAKSGTAVVFKYEGKFYDKAPWADGARELDAAAVEALEETHELVVVEYVHDWGATKAQAR